MKRRLIPVLLLDSKRRLVKTVKFGERTYVGDPFNVIRLFNEKEVDEICVLDIDATSDGREPDFAFITELSNECFMPLSYGGGITQLGQCERLSRLGVEKLVLGQSALDAALVSAISRDLGAQAVSACVDVVGSGATARCITRIGRTAPGPRPLDFCRELQEQGVGEIWLQSVDRDGMRLGYDLELIHSLASQLKVPLVALGGAGNTRHLAQGLRAGASAVASGSAFAFFGRLRAVLISYPGSEEMDWLDAELSS